FLDLARRDVLAAADDHLLLAIDDVEVPLGIHVADVARVQKAAAQGGFGLLRQPVIAEHDAGPAHHDLAALVGWQLVILLVDDGKLGARERNADRPRLARTIEAVHARTARTLGESIALEYNHLELLLEGAQGLDRDRRAAADGEAERAQIEEGDLLARTIE